MSIQIRFGTSSFTVDSWNGAFYPRGMKSAEHLRYYSSRFDTVEVDSTFYHCPTASAVNNLGGQDAAGLRFLTEDPANDHA